MMLETFPIILQSWGCDQFSALEEVLKVTVTLDLNNMMWPAFNSQNEELTNVIDQCYEGSNI